MCLSRIYRYGRSRKSKFFHRPSKKSHSFIALEKKVILSLRSKSELFQCRRNEWRDLEQNTSAIKTFVQLVFDSMEKAVGELRGKRWSEKMSGILPIWKKTLWRNFSLMFIPCKHRALFTWGNETSTPALVRPLLFALAPLSPPADTIQLQR